MTDRGITGKSIQWKYPSSSWTLKKIDISVSQGSFLLITGASGSGKSTLCSTFNGLIPRTRQGLFEGEIKVFGRDTRETPVSALSRDVGMVLQNADSQLFNSSVSRELSYGLESMGLPRDKIDQRVKDDAELFGIKHLLERDPKHLSGGEQKIVLIAAIFAMRPRILVLDEPFANLDYPSILLVKSVLRTCLETGMGVVVCEHRIHLLFHEAERIVVMENGTIRFDGTPAEALSADLSILKQRFKPADLKLPKRQKESKNQTIKPEPVLECRGLYCRRDDISVLHNINLTIHRGESVAILGKNGAGKTTLLRHFNGLIRPDKGSVTVSGVETRSTQVHELAKQVGLVFQNPDHQFFRRTVREEVETGAKALGSFDAGRIENLLKRLDISHLSSQLPFFASEGEKKRIAVASVLSGDQSILILDEPAEGLDWISLDSLAVLLNELVSLGHTLVIVTHDAWFARLVANRWIILSDGTVAADGSPESLISDTRLISRAGLDTSFFHPRSGAAYYA